MRTNPTCNRQRKCHGAQRREQVSRLPASESLLVSRELGISFKEVKHNLRDQWKFGKENKVYGDAFRCRVSAGFFIFQTPDVV